VAAGLVERLRGKGYNFCVIDPEGDYDAMGDVAFLGGAERSPSVDECMLLLARPEENAVINLLGLKFNDRPAFFMSLFARARDLRAKTGRPHWLVVDEAHHVMPADWKPTEVVLPHRFDGIVLVSVSPASISRAALALIESLIVLGEEPRNIVREFAEANEVAAPEVSLDKIPAGEALIWHKASREAPKRITLEPSHGERRRHLRKYAQGSLGDDRSFYFRGPAGKLNLRAGNLVNFLDLADGVDAATWLFHWQRGDVSHWLRTSIKDDPLADRIAAAERELRSDEAASRKRVRELIEESYTLPAEDGGKQ